MSRAGPVLKHLPRRSSPLDPWRYPRRERTSSLELYSIMGKDWKVVCVYGEIMREHEHRERK